MFTVHKHHNFSFIYKILGSFDLKSVKCKDPVDLINKSTPIDVWLQGTIEQTVGTDILIISDTTGRAKVSKCDTAHGIIDKSSLKKGTYCCIIGVAVKTKGVPEVHASKFIDLTSQPQMKLAWEAEVKEANLFLEGKLIPTI